MMMIIYRKTTTFTYTCIHPPIHLRQSTIPPHITQLSSTAMTDRLTMNPRHRNADLPSSQQWHPSERRPFLPSTALFRGIHLSSAGLEKADGTRESRS